MGRKWANIVVFPPPASAPRWKAVTSQRPTMPQVTYVVCALGDADIIAEAVVYSAEGMDHFLKHGMLSL